MKTTADRITGARKKVDEHERQLRLKLKEERDAEKKRNQKINYIIGELVTKYFPELLQYEPGTKAENSLRFKPVEAFISTLADNSELLKQIADECDYNKLKQQNHYAESGFVYVDTENIDDLSSEE